MRGALQGAGWGAAGLCLLVLSVGGQVLKGFRYPEYDAQGALKFEISGDEAEVVPDGRIAIKNLKMTFYEQGKIMMEVATSSCLFDRVRKSAVSTAEVWMARQEVELTGRGFAWNADDGRFVIQTNARVVLRYEGRAPSREGAP